MTHPAPHLKLSSVSKVLKTEEVETYAVRHVSLEIEPGEHVAVMGPSGCGKSTLLSLLGMLAEPTEGTYLMDGTPVSRRAPRERMRQRSLEIGFIFQSFNLFCDLTVQENVELPLRFRKWSPRERSRAAAEALERVGMGHRRNHLPSQLSGGQQQRVAIARAVAGGPRLLLADEPTGNLDSASGRAVMELLCALHATGTTTLCIATHDPYVASLAQRRIEMRDGTVVADARPEPLPAPQVSSRLVPLGSGFRLTPARVLTR